MVDSFQVTGAHRRPFHDDDGTAFEDAVGTGLGKGDSIRETRASPRGRIHRISSRHSGRYLWLLAHPATGVLHIDRIIPASASGGVRSSPNGPTEHSAPNVLLSSVQPA